MTLEQNKVKELFAADDWAMGLVKSDTGKLIECWQNVNTLLTHLPEWAGTIAFDAFSQVSVKLKETPTGSPAGEWTPNDEYLLGMWLSQRHQFTLKSLATINTGVMACANANRFHPVLDWLKTLAWDGKARLATWLHECLGAEQSEYADLVGRFFILNMVRRVQQPGCIMRYVPVLEGAQNMGKSTALRLLAQPWFSDVHLDLTSKDAFELIQGVWLLEISEMGAFNKSEITRVKHFVSTVEDSWVPKYVRGRIKVKRQVMFSGSTNEGQYLKDWTGGTRYLPIRCLVTGAIELERLQAMRDQLFAEAVALLAGGARAYATPEQEALLFAPQQEERLVDHPWREPIVKWLEEVSADGRRDTVSTFELLTGACKVDVSKMTLLNQQDVGRIMDSLGWPRKREPKGLRRWFYHRPDAVEYSSKVVEEDDDIPF